MSDNPPVYPPLTYLGDNFTGPSAEPPKPPEDKDWSEQDQTLLNTPKEGAD